MLKDNKGLLCNVFVTWKFYLEEKSLKSIFLNDY